MDLVETKAMQLSPDVGFLQRGRSQANFIPLPSTAMAVGTKDVPVEICFFVGATVHKILKN